MRWRFSLFCYKEKPLENIFHHKIKGFDLYTGLNKTQEIRERLVDICIQVPGCMKQTSTPGKSEFLVSKVTQLEGNKERRKKKGNSSRNGDMKLMIFFSLPLFSFSSLKCKQKDLELILLV